MIVPRTKLIGWTAAIVLPFAAVATTVPGGFVVSLLFIGALIFFATFDALTARSQLTGLRVELPGMLRLQKDRAAELELRICNDSLEARTLRVGFAFPAAIESAEDDRFTVLPADAAISRLLWPVMPRVRGQYFIEEVFLEAASPIGFWAIRTIQPLRAELRVYPNLHAERRSAAAVFLRRGQLGSRALRRAGQGREFEKLREYVPGDSFEEIHWKASAKRGHPVTKVFQIERSQEVYVIVDASRLSGRKVAGAPLDASLPDQPQSTVLERYVTAALILGTAAEQQGDQFGLVTFSDRVLSFVRAKNGQAHYDACRDRLYGLQPQAVTPDFDELCAFIRLRLRKRALLIFLTALDDPMLAESFTKSVELLCRQHLVLVNMLRPAGAQPLFANAAVEEPTDLYEQIAGHFRWRDLRELESVLHRRGVRLSLLDAARLSAQLVAQHAEIKARQLV